MYQTMSIIVDDDILQVLLTKGKEKKGRERKEEKISQGMYISSPWTFRKDCPDTVNRRLVHRQKNRSQE